MGEWAAEREGERERGGECTAALNFRHLKSDFCFPLLLSLSLVSVSRLAGRPPAAPAVARALQVTFYGAGTMATESNGVEPFLVFELMELGALRGLLASQRVRTAQPCMTQPRTTQPSPLFLFLYSTTPYYAKGWEGEVY